MTPDRLLEKMLTGDIGPSFVESLRRTLIEGVEQNFPRLGHELGKHLAKGPEAQEGVR